MLSKIEILTSIDTDPVESVMERADREEHRFTVETTTSADEALGRVRDRPPDCVLLEVSSSGTDGLELLRAVREICTNCPIIVVAETVNQSLVSDAIAAGVTDVLSNESAEQYKLLTNRIVNAARARRSAQEAARRAGVMRLAESATDTGGWELDVATGELWITAGTRELIGISSADALTAEEAVKMIHADDRQKLRAAVIEAVQTGERMSGTYRYQPRSSERDRLVDITAAPVTSGREVTALRGVVSDISNLRQQQQKLDSERRFYEQSLNALDDLFYVLNPDGTIHWCNDRVSDVSGYTRSELHGMHAIEVFAEDERAKIAGAIAQVLNGTDTVVEADLATVDGDRIPHEWSGNLLTDANGDAAGIAGVGRDLTERREREQEFRSLVEYLGDMVSIIDADGRVQYQSPAIESILGYDTQETVGDTVWEYVHPDDHTTIRSTVEELRTDSAQWESVRFRVKHTDGSWRWISARVVKMLDGPIINGYIISGRDITEQEADRQRLELFEILSENIQECQFIVDAADNKFELVYANEYYKWTVGLTPNREVAGQTPTTLFGEAGGQEVINWYEECIEQRDTITYTVELSVPEEGTVYRTVLTPVINHGEVTHIVGAAREVTNGQT